MPRPPLPLVGAGSTGGELPGGGGARPTARRAGATVRDAVLAAVWAPVTTIFVDSAPAARGLRKLLTLDGGVVDASFAGSMCTEGVAPGMLAVALVTVRVAFAAG